MWGQRQESTGDPGARKGEPRNLSSTGEGTWSSYTPPDYRKEIFPPVTPGEGRRGKRLWDITVDTFFTSDQLMCTGILLLGKDHQNVGKGMYFHSVQVLFFLLLGIFSL